MGSPRRRITEQTTRRSMARLAEAWEAMSPGQRESRWHTEDSDALCEYERGEDDRLWLAQLLDALPQLRRPAVKVVAELMARGMAEIHAIRAAIVQIEEAIEKGWEML